MLGKQPILSAIGGNYRAQAEDNSLFYQGNGVETEKETDWGYNTHLKAKRFAGGLNQEGEEGEWDKWDDTLLQT